MTSAGPKELLDSLIATYARRIDNVDFEDEKKVVLINEAISGHGLSTEPLDERYQALRAQLCAFLDDVSEPAGRYNDRNTFIFLCGGLTGLSVFMLSPTLLFNGNFGAGIVTGLVFGGATAYLAARVETRDFENAKESLFKTYAPRLEEILYSNGYKTAKQVTTYINSRITKS